MAKSITIDKYYDELLQKNPVFSNFKHITDYDTKLCPFDKILGVDATNYISERSLLFLIESNGFKKSYNGKDMLVTYRVLVTVGPPVNEAIGIAEGYRDRANLYSTPFYNEFFVHSPNSVSRTNCHGDKCRRSFMVKETGIWCTACHGEFDEDATNLYSLFRDTILFSQIPKDSILFIEMVIKKIKKTDMDDISKIRTYFAGEKLRIAYLHDLIDTSEERIRSFIKKEEEEQKKRKDQLSLMMAEYGSYEDFDSLYKKYDTQLKHLTQQEKRREEIRSEKERLEKLEAERKRKEEEERKLQEKMEQEKAQKEESIRKKKEFLLQLRAQMLETNTKNLKEIDEQIQSL